MRKVGKLNIKASFNKYCNIIRNLIINKSAFYKYSTRHGRTTRARARLVLSFSTVKLVKIFWAAVPARRDTITSSPTLCTREAASHVTTLVRKMGTARRYRTIVPNSIALFPPKYMNLLLKYIILYFIESPPPIYESDSPSPSLYTGSPSPSPKKGWGDADYIGVNKGYQGD